MKKRTDENGKYVSVPRELYERLLETKVGTTGSMIKQSIIDHTVRYVIIGLIIVGIGTGGYYYFIHPTVEKIEKTIDKTEKKIDDFKSSKIFHPSKWFSSDKNETSESIVESQEVPEVVVEEVKASKEENKTSTLDRIKVFFTTDDNTSIDSVDGNISQDENKTSFFTKAKGWFSWGKKDKNTTKE